MNPLHAFCVLSLCVILSQATGNVRRQVSSDSCDRLSRAAYCRSGITESALRCDSFNVSDPSEYAQCAVNENGDICFLDLSSRLPNYLSEIRNLCSTNGPGECPTECNNTLQRVHTELGCCLSLFNGSARYSDIMFNWTLWSSCKVETSNTACQGIFNITQSNPGNCSSQDVEFTAEDVVDLYCLHPGVPTFIETMNQGNCQTFVQQYLISFCGFMNGRYCYIDNTNVDFDILDSIERCIQNATCSSNCKTNLLKLRDAHGCCVNSIIFNNTIWNHCEIEWPGFCEVRYNCGAESPGVCEGQLNCGEPPDFCMLQMNERSTENSTKSSEVFSYTPFKVVIVVIASITLYLNSYQ